MVSMSTPINVSLLKVTVPGNDMWWGLDAVGAARHLVDELPAAEAVGAQWQVQPVLLYCSDANNDDGLRLVLEPVLESGTGELLYPELG